MKSLATFTIAALVAVFSTASFAADEKPAEHPAAKAEAPKAAKPDTGKGSTSFAAVCAACHGADGNSGVPANPKLAQQHPEYLVKQLQDFKGDKRKSAVMKPFASALSDDDMRNIAWWAAGQKAKAGFAKEKDLVALGERIYRGGLADRSVPACAGCHSPNGAGIPSQYPRLGGQHADYTEAQLKAFRDGQRTNSPQMAGVAAKMSDKEIKAVADYIAGLR